MLEIFCRKGKETSLKKARPKVKGNSSTSSRRLFQNLNKFNGELTCRSQISFLILEKYWTFFRKILSIRKIDRPQVIENLHAYICVNDQSWGQDCWIQSSAKKKKKERGKCLKPLWPNKLGYERFIIWQRIILWLESRTSWMSSSLSKQ